MIDALKYLKIKNKHKNIYIYSTGSKRDYRRPNHFDDLMKDIKQNNINKNYIYLGTVPFIDVMSLIYHSKAILNPSFFEGWSSTVEQAKAYNKKIILSKISVHFEQKPDNAIFFDPKIVGIYQKFCFKYLKKKPKTRNVSFKKSKKIKFKN